MNINPKGRSVTGTRAVARDDDGVREVSWFGVEGASHYRVEFTEPPTARAVFLDGSTVDIPVTFS